ncbi:hypothetical protein EXIGLDRAFT_701460 [Exidia glandulosa HHB12029]|uniref:Calmodulin n=1 Tax=Exidia glandulosa HHB12029 TaxID=1314781 RepID=A0A165CXZ6_EXIGL|nr:hypothetical protein EXIGLDRAFT_701460 [Exidia glandulosa HHB12029]
MSTSESPKKRFSLRRTLSKRFSSHRGDRRQVTPLPDEKPVLVLRVQVLGCKGLEAADWNGKSDPYVVATFQRQRQKTPVIQKNLNPTWNAKDATFDFPIYQSVAERLGTLLELVVWDKDMLSKDYLAELPLACSEWFAHNGGPAAYDFASPKNKPFWLDLQSSRSTKEAKGSINVKLGLVSPPGTKNIDFATLYALLVKKSRGDIFSASAMQGIGTVGEGGSGHLPVNEDSSDEESDGEDDASAKTLVKSWPSFRLNWEGTKIDYSFSQHKEIAGILLLEVKSAADLPKQKDLGKSGIECDPCAVINFGKRTARTRVIRHTLEPEWNERLILIVPADGTHSKISLSVLNWDTISGEDTLGETTLDVSAVFADAPKADAKTGLFPPEASIGAGMKEFKLPLTVPKDAGFEMKGAPVLVVSAKFEHHAAFRQRFWRAHLHEFDKDKSGTFSRKEVIAFLRDLGIHLDASKIDELFVSSGKNTHGDQLTLEEAVIALETLIGVPRPTDAPKAKEPEPAAEAPAPVVAEEVVTSPVVEQPTTAGAADGLFEEEKVPKTEDSWIQVKDEQPAPASAPEKEVPAEVVEVVPPTEVSPPKSIIDAKTEKDGAPAPSTDHTPPHEPSPVPEPTIEAPPPTKPGRGKKPEKKAAAAGVQPKPPARRGVSAAEAERAASYAALVLADARLEITAERIVALLNASGIELEMFWASVFERACAGKDVGSMLLNVGASGAGAGASGGGQTSVAANGDAGGEGAKSEEARAAAAPAEESDEDMGFGLFD